MQDLRKAAIQGIILTEVRDNLGIYAESVIGGPTSYETRTEWMEGWNACVRKFSELARAVEDWLEKLPEAHKTDIEDLLLADEIFISRGESGFVLCIPCDDLFYWACSDLEELAVDDIAALKECLKLTERGGLLFACRKRGMRPQTPYYKYFTPEEVELFNAAGPPRDDTGSLGNPNL